MSKILTASRTVTVFAVTVLIFTIATHSLYSENKYQSYIVKIRNLEFNPRELEVSPGDTITWVNYDVVPHTVTADNESWDSDLIGSQQQWQTVVLEYMYKSYYCRYHPSMKARIRIIKK